MIFLKMYKEKLIKTNTITITYIKEYWYTVWIEIEESTLIRCLLYYSSSKKFN